MSTEPVRVTRAAPAGDPDEVESALRAEGLVPSRWGNAPGFRYGEHDHPYDKVLVCVAGGIVFHTPSGDVELTPGDRLELGRGVSHAATVGERGVTCVEAPRR